MTTLSRRVIVSGSRPKTRSPCVRARELPSLRARGRKEQVEAAENLVVALWQRSAALNLDRLLPPVEYPGFYWIVLYRTPTMNKFLREMTLEFTNSHLEQWARFMTPSFDRIFLWTTRERTGNMETTHREPFHPNLDESAAFQDWCSPWVSLAEVAKWYHDHHEHIRDSCHSPSARIRPSTGNMSVSAAMGGYRGHGRSQDFAWAIDSMDTPEGPVCCPVVDVHPGAFLGVVSGEVRYGRKAATLPKSKCIYGPYDLVVHRPGSRFIHLVLGKRGQGNVRLGLEAYLDQGLSEPPTRHIYERPISWIVLAFAAESCASFSPLRF